MKALEVGVIVKPHGLGGELKVRLYWAESEALSRAPAVELHADSRRRVCDIEWARAGPRGALLKLRGVDDRDAAEAWRGARLFVAREHLAPLERGEYYLADLVGCEVRGPDRALGTVVEVRPHPSVDALVIADAAGRRFEQPLAGAWVSEVDVERRLVRLSTLEGLIEEPGGEEA